MTSTSFNVGLTDNTRLSSRVLRPPGGGHTDIFGGEPEPVRGKRQGPPQTDSFQQEAADKAAAAAASAAATNGNVEAHAPAPVPQEQHASEPVQQKQDVPNPTKPAPQAAQPQTEAPKRVRVPPGGFSSGLW